ncbi:MAG: hypothetical protein PHG48_03670 [Eubacteriales bacterium]|nr:hypothetical protein [Eubacteriales bacterium]
MSNKIRYFTAPKVITETVLAGKGGFIIPASAILHEGSSVYVVETRENFWGKEHHVRIRDVQTGDQAQKYFFIIAGGLVHGDVVVTGYDRKISNGDRVEIIR